MSYAHPSWDTPMMSFEPNSFQVNSWLTLLEWTAENLFCDNLYSSLDDFPQEDTRFRSLKGLFRRDEWMKLCMTLLSVRVLHLTLAKLFSGIEILLVEKLQIPALLAPLDSYRALVGLHRALQRTTDKALTDGRA